MKQYVVLCCIFSCFFLISCNSEKPKSSAQTTTQTTPQTYIRRNAHSPAAAADLQALAKGVAFMKSLPCTDNRSWYYWGAMHHIPGISDMGGYDTLCPTYGSSFGPPDTWSNCPHMLPGTQQLHFLAWHRLYTWYFERIVRKFSGKQDFAMPYWDYNTPNERTMPDLFRAPTGYNTNALWESGRSRWLMAGNAIRSSDTDSIAVNVNGIVKNVFADPMGIILDTAFLWAATDFAHFSAETEEMPHNCMHDYIGGAVDAFDTKPPIYNRIYQNNSNQGLMAQVPSAGFDPIFFLHHANIDRLWTNWELDFPQEALTMDEFGQAGMWTYNFIDENGKEIHYTSLQQVFDSIRSINYQYDYLAQRPAVKELLAKKPGWNSGEVVTTVSPVLKLSAPGDHFSLDFTKKLKSPKESEVFYSLEIEISVARPTHNFLAIMMDVNDNVPISADVKKHVTGIAGLFGLQNHEGHMGHGEQMGDMRIHKTLVYDLNQQLMLQNGFDKKGLTVYVHQMNPDKANPVFIEKVTVKEFTRKQ